MTPKIEIYVKDIIELDNNPDGTFRVTVQNKDCPQRIGEYPRVELSDGETILHPDKKGNYLLKHYLTAKELLERQIQW